MNVTHAIDNCDDGVTIYFLVCVYIYIYIYI